MHSAMASWKLLSCCWKNFVGSVGSLCSCMICIRAGRPKCPNNPICAQWVMRANRIMTSSVDQCQCERDQQGWLRADTSGCSSTEVHATVHTAQAVLSSTSLPQQVVPYTTAYPKSVYGSCTCNCEHTGLLGSDTVSCAHPYIWPPSPSSTEPVSLSRSFPDPSRASRLFCRRAHVRRDAVKAALPGKPHRPRSQVSLRATSVFSQASSNERLIKAAHTVAAAAYTHGAPTSKQSQAAPSPARDVLMILRLATQLQRSLQFWPQ